MHTLLTERRAVLTECRALLTECRALLTRNRALYYTGLSRSQAGCHGRLFKLTLA